MAATRARRIDGAKLAASLNRRSVNIAVDEVKNTPHPDWTPLHSGAAVRAHGLSMQIDGEPLEKLADEIDGRHHLLYREGTKIDILEYVPGSPYAGVGSSTQTGELSFDEVRAEFPEGYVIDIVRKGEKYNDDAWGRYGRPATDIPDSLETPNVPGSNLVDELVKRSDPNEVWWLFLKAKKPSGTPADLEKLDLADPPPAPPEGPDYGRFGGADDLNRIITRRLGGGERKPNFGFYPSPSPLRKGWERVVQPKSLPAAVRDSQVLIDGRAENLSILLDGLGRDVSFAHAEGTSWTSFEEDQKAAKWPPYEKPADEKAGEGRSGLPKLTGRLWFGIGATAVLLIAILASWRPSIAGLLLVGGIIALGTVILTRDLRAPYPVIGQAAVIGGVLALLVTFIALRGDGLSVTSALLRGVLAWLVALLVIGLIGTLADVVLGSRTEEASEDPRWRIGLAIVSIIVGLFAALLTLSLANGGTSPTGPADTCYWLEGEQKEACYRGETIPTIP
jgi:hypothetical protein